MKQILLTAVFAASLAAPASAEIVIRDAYARASNAMAGAAFMEIENTGPEDDRLLSVASEAAKRTELHTHRESAEGVMRMIHLEEGLALPAGETRLLARGGDHVMFMGLTAPMEQGAEVTVTFRFESGAEQVVQIPVDLERRPDHAAHGGHAGHDAHGGAMPHDPAAAGAQDGHSGH